MAHPQIAAFARLAKENTPPTRALEGQKTLISRTMHAFAYDPIHDEIVVTSPLASGILIFRGSANGNEAPIRVIQGPRTQIVGINDKVSVDPVNNEILASTGGTLTSSGPNAILVFDREANGDVAPKRVLTGPDTGLGRGVGQAQVDPIRNLLLVNGNRKLMIFDRTASGNAKPKAVIEGPKSGMDSTNSFQLYPPKGWVITACADGAVCAWSVNDNGDVPPRWKIPVQQLTGYEASGMALDVAHKEIIFSSVGPRPKTGTGQMNAVITFAWPEIFQ